MGGWVIYYDKKTLCNIGKTYTSMDTYKYCGMICYDDNYFT